tara:strand:- start:1215 stop:1448 length:234 start_codon:yes stop_codon:yes gene_type:complete
MPRNNYNHIKTNLEIVTSNAESLKRYIDKGWIDFAKVEAKSLVECLDIVNTYLNNIIEIEDRYWNQQADLQKERENG